MIRKMLSLIIPIVLFLGVNETKAQVEPCCYDDIIAAVADLQIEADLAGMNVPICLTYQAGRLQDICDGTATFPCPVQIILDRMSIVVDKILTDNGWPFCWPDEVPTTVQEELENLQNLLTEGCIPG